MYTNSLNSIFSLFFCNRTEDAEQILLDTQRSSGKLASVKCGKIKYRFSNFITMVWRDVNHILPHFFFPLSITNLLLSDVIVFVIYYAPFYYSSLESKCQHFLVGKSKSFYFRSYQCRLRLHAIVCVIQNFKLVVRPYRNQHSVVVLYDILYIVIGRCDDRNCISALVSYIISI